MINKDLINHLIVYPPGNQHNDGKRKSFVFNEVNHGTKIACFFYSDQWIRQSWINGQNIVMIKMIPYDYHLVI